MASTNNLSILAELLAIALASAAISAVEAYTLFPSDCGDNETHNFYYGTRGIFDKLLYTDVINKESSFIKKVVVDVEYPPAHREPLGYITYMEVLDQLTDSNGGCAYLVNGGVGQNIVNFHLKSQIGGALSFKINIYGLDNVCIDSQTIIM